VRGRGVGRVAAIAVAATVLAASSVTAAADSSGGSGGARRPGSWRQLGHDNTSTFHNPRSSITPKRAASLEPAWQLDVPGTVNGAAAASGDRVFALSGDGLLALDAETGDEIWRRDDITGTASPTLARGVLYVQTADTMLWAVDADDGEDRWQVVADDQEFATGFSSPVVAANVVVVGLSSVEEVAAEANAQFRGGVAAFDRRTGEEVWRYRTAEPPYNGVGVWSTVSIDEAAETVFATTGNNYTELAGPTSDSIIALDLGTGEPRWISQMTPGGDVFTIPNPVGPDFGFGTNPILFEAQVDGVERELLGAGQKSGAFSVLDRATGEVVWQQQVSNGSALIGGIFNNGAYDGDRIIVAGNDQAAGTSLLVALDPATGDVQWERELPAWVWAPITLGDGVGFVAADNQVQAFDTETGEQLFTFAAEGTISSAPVPVGNRVYFGSGLSYITTTRGQTFYALEG
jgi:polyvinyl alcohol dehydrogenase (cytochrome)